MTAWLVVLLAGLGSYLLRISMIMLADRITLPPRIEQASGFVAPTAFAALAATGLTAATRGADLTQALPLLAAVVVAVVAVRRTGRPYVAVLAGMPVLWLLSAAVGS
jgi:branched-subunit amino acid transport protein